MTQTTEEKALALLNEVLAERVHWQMTGTRADNASIEALCRAIEQHEAFQQEVSNVVWDYYGGKHIPRTSMFAKFAIPKPDPLVEATLQVFPDNPFAKEHSDRIRAALDELGFEIREKSDAH